ncbi:FAD-binding oxidoreductase [Actinoplanes sp. NPDC049265]|uniref:FAD-binding oxidoreductase n=1 Tax=Actinoplanes sp. NPDC049265 TaxID=3363902 RepID=UPI0037128BBE
MTAAGEFAELAAAVAGPVLTPGQAGYDEECATYNLMSPLRPEVAVGVTGVADIEACVRFAARRDMAIAVRGQAHMVAKPAAGALLISLRRMSRVAVDADRRTVRVEGAATWGEVLAAAAPYGLAPPVGSTLTVSAIGFVLGGGQSPALGRAHGHASDHVSAFEVVTADGTLRRVTPDEQPDLFFALRGGKGNFGVVAAVEMRLFEVRTIVGGGLWFAGERMAEVLHAWREWVPRLPVEASSSVAVQRLPPVPELPEPLRGAFVVHVRFTHLGDPATAEELLAPLRAAAPVILDSVREMPFTEIDTVHADPQQPIPYFDRSTGLRELTKDGVEALVDVLGPGAVTSVIHAEIRALGGHLDREPAVADAVPTRGLAFQLFAFAVGGPPRAEALRADLAALIRQVEPWTDRRSMPNFLSPDEARTPERVRALYGPDLYDELSAVKARHDPRNLFRINHTIVPAAHPSDAP